MPRRKASISLANICPNGNSLSHGQWPGRNLPQFRPDTPLVFGLSAESIPLTGSLRPDMVNLITLIAAKNIHTQ